MEWRWPMWRYVSVVWILRSLKECYLHVTHSSNLHASDSTCPIMSDSSNSRAKVHTSNLQQNQHPGQTSLWACWHWRKGAPFQRCLYRHQSVRTSCSLRIAWQCQPYQAHRWTKQNLAIPGIDVSLVQVDSGDLNMGHFKVITVYVSLLSWCNELWLIIEEIERNNKYR